MDRNTVRQLDGIEVERTFINKASEKDTAQPKLDELIAFVRDGDTVIVHSMTGSPATSMTCAGSCGP